MASARDEAQTALPVPAARTDRQEKLGGTAARASLPLRKATGIRPVATNDPTLATLNALIGVVQRFNGLVDKSLTKTPATRPFTIALKAVPLLVLLACIVLVMMSTVKVGLATVVLTLGTLFYVYMLIMCGLAILPGNTPSFRKVGRDAAIALSAPPAVVAVILMFPSLMESAKEEAFSFRIRAYRLMGTGYAESLTLPSDQNSEPIQLVDSSLFIGPSAPVTSITQVLPLNFAAASGTAEQAALLRLVSRLNIIEVPAETIVQPPDVSLPGEIWVAARRVILRRNSVLRIGSRNLMIAAYELIVEHGARIEAYPPDEDAAARKAGDAKGAKAGDVHVILLGQMPGGEILTVDLAGENGLHGSPGKGGQGYTPDNTREKPLNGISDVVATSNIGKFKNAISEARNALALADSSAQPEKRVLIDECAEAESCIILRCTQPPGDGLDGLTGVKGGPGAPGGNGGPGGTLHLHADPTEIAHLEKRIILKGQTSEHPRIGAASKGGIGGEGGPPSLGKPGEKAGNRDDLGICGVGRPGRRGEPGPPGEKGQDGFSGEPSLVKLEPIWSYELPP